MGGKYRLDVSILEQVNCFDICEKESIDKFTIEFKGKKEILRGGGGK